MEDLFLGGIDEDAFIVFLPIYHDVSSFFILSLCFWIAAIVPDKATGVDGGKENEDYPHALVYV
jgi:hypothetical protein